MPEVLIALILGVVQGFSEFLPISSSGHLRLIQEIFGWTDDFGLVFDTWIHVASLAAVVVYFRSDIGHMITSAFSADPERQADKRLGKLIVVATIPTGLIGLFGGDFFEYAPVIYLGIAFIITAVVLTLADALTQNNIGQPHSLSWKKAGLIGVAQGIAIMPGISRSGATMAAGMALGLTREQAARFSFLLSGPVIILAAAKQTVDVIVLGEPGPGVLPTIVGFVASGITGYLAISGLMAYLRTRSFRPFAAYTGLLGIGVIVWQLIVR